MLVKHLSLNMWGGLLLENVESFLKDENPQIISLQEVYRARKPAAEARLDSYYFIRKRLKFRHCAYSPALFEKRNGDVFERGNAIFSRFPVLATKATFFDIAYGEMPVDPTDPETISLYPYILQETGLKVGNCKLSVFNVHGIRGTNNEYTERRLNMSRIIINEIMGKNNVVLSGDFNIDIRSRTIQNIEARLHNVFKGRLKTSFNMSHKKGGTYHKSVVDMFFVSRDMRVVNSYCPQVNVSDHIPLVLEYEI